MSSRIILSYLLVAVMLLPTVGNAVHVGQSPDGVRNELGSPNGVRKSGEREIWVYSGDITIEFEQGKLVRAKGLVLETPTIQRATEPAAVSSMRQAPKPEKPAPPVVQTPVAGESPVPVAANEEESKPLMQDLADTIDEYEHLEERALAEFGDYGEIPESATFLEQAIAMALPVFLTFIFLVIAFKVTGAEAMKLALLVIAVVDFLVVRGVQWFFLGFLELPMTFHADTALSIVVMLILITKMTHARQLPTAIRVVVASKVAAMAAFWLLAIFILHRL